MAMEAKPTPLADVKAAIAAAARVASRDPAAVTLIAVSKTMPEDRIQPLLAQGHRDFGENRVQEAQAKWPALRAAFPDTHLHLIGALQTNKAVDAVTTFDTIHSLDRPSLAEALRRACDRTGRTPAMLVQVNTGAEPQKAGCLPDDLPGLLALACDTLALPVIGLMAIPPHDEEPAPHFALLAKLARRHDLPHLSMGMSADFVTAVQLGATFVRVGTALFGARATTGDSE